MRQMTTGWMMMRSKGAGAAAWARGEAASSIVWMMDATHTGLSPVLSIFGVSTL